MKLPFPPSCRRSAAASVVAILAVFILGGCASMDAPDTERLLTQAGFTPRKPETPQQAQAYASMEDFEINRAVVRGQTLYAYKNSKKGMVYIGGEKEMSEYDRLRTHEAIDNSQSSVPYDSWHPRRKIRR